ncbi:unnamed protein product [Diatraea saccharalis]|uniref:Immunoglobulin domain-containing protein n=1 Tax=Diatraea saccharalis TaxID=40085 RepID=A0A9N9RBL4_9NEOP|nr:unnamed protein product [Diatraea saccharalis]
MWTRVWFVAACAVYAAGDITAPAQETLNIGDALETSIETFKYDNFICSLETPNNEIIQFVQHNDWNREKYELRAPNPMTGCAVTVTITGPEDNGIWRLFIEFEDKTPVSRFFNVFVKGIQDSDALNNDEREIENLGSKFITTHVGALHKVIINKYDLLKTESCHLISNDGTEYNNTNIESAINKFIWIEDNNVACGVQFVAGENMIGNWILFSREIRHSIDRIEKRLSFNIYIEEHVEAMPEEIIVAAGNNVHIRLVNSPPKYLQQTCKLVGPNQELTQRNYDRDDNNIESCGFIIRNIQTMDKGIWHIIFGNSIIYKAPVQITVIGEDGDFTRYLKWTIDSSVDVSLGPENATYCRVADPAGRTVFENFSQCRITLDRVSQNHKGTWILIVGSPGRIITEEHRIDVFVTDLEPRPKVITSVEKQQTEVLLSCVLPGDHQLRTCKFRDPQGRVLLALEGVEEDRYSFHEGNVNHESNVSTVSCALRIKNPVNTDLGIWRCAMETADDDVYFGFLQVADNVVTEPTLSAYESYITRVEGESVTMSCSIQSEIRYCYFRADNGTIFNVNPGMSTDSMEYVGAGFEAGECGVMMHKLQQVDSGLWSCHVGLPGNSSMFAPEQQKGIMIDILPIFKVSQGFRHIQGGMEVTGRIYESRAVDYCRYIRIDGQGFTDDNLPIYYYSSSDTDNGICRLYIRNPTLIDKHPWTIVTRVRGQREEISRTTNPNFILPPTPLPPPVPQPPNNINSWHAARFWIMITMLSVTIVFFGLIMSAQKNRRWTSERAAAFRNSFRYKKNPDTRNENSQVSAA